VRPFLRRCDRGRLAPVGWVSEPAGEWAGRQVEVVYDPERHQIAIIRNETSDAARALLAGAGFRRRAADRVQEMWVRTRPVETDQEPASMASVHSLPARRPIAAEGRGR